MIPSPTNIQFWDKGGHGFGLSRVNYLTFFTIYVYYYIVVLDYNAHLVWKLVHQTLILCVY